MLNIHISYGVTDDCKNLEESYGEICVQCNKCGRFDKEEGGNGGQGMTETWKAVKGYEGLYEVSNLGKVRRSEHEERNSIQEVRILPERILKQTFNFRGYLKVGLSKDNKKKDVFVHRLVADAFIDNPNNYPQVNHKDEDKTNNCVDNLEWCTNLYNANYGTKRKQKLSNNLKRYWERKRQEVLEDGNDD